MGHDPVLTKIAPVKGLLCGGAKSSEAPEPVSRFFRDLAVVWVESPGEWPTRHGLGQAKRLGHVSFEGYEDWSGVE